jgi:hypothetical protein
MRTYVSRLHLTAALAALAWLAACKADDVDVKSARGSVVLDPEATSGPSGDAQPAVASEEASQQPLEDIDLTVEAQPSQGLGLADLTDVASFEGLFSCKGVPDQVVTASPQIVKGNRDCILKLTKIALYDRPSAPFVANDPAFAFKTYATGDEARFSRGVAGETLIVKVEAQLGDAPKGAAAVRYAFARVKIDRQTLTASTVALPVDGDVGAFSLVATELQQTGQRFFIKLTFQCVEAIAQGACYGTKLADARLVYEQLPTDGQVTPVDVLSIPQLLDTQGGFLRQLVALGQPLASLPSMIAGDKLSITMPLDAYSPATLPRVFAGIGTTTGAITASLLDVRTTSL